MIDQITKATAKWLNRNGVITQNDKELFTYATYSLLFGLAPIALTVILGFAFGMLQEGIFIIAPFMLIRKFSGGYHMKSPLSCIILSTIIIATAFLTTKYIISSGKISVSIVFAILSVISISIFSPIDSDAKKLSSKEVKLFGIIAKVMAIIFLMVNLLMLLYGYIENSAAIGIGITLPALLQWPCILKIANIKHYCCK